MFKVLCFVCMGLVFGSIPYTLDFLCSRKVMKKSRNKRDW